MRAVLDREVSSLAERTLQAADRADTLGGAIEAVMLTAAETFHTHPALGFVLEHEPELDRAASSRSIGAGALADGRVRDRRPRLRSLPPRRPRRTPRRVG